jgi:hypothetical protein
LRPLQPFLPHTTYERLNYIVLTTIYSPFLCCIAYYESKSSPLLQAECRFQARRISKDRLTGLEDGESSLGWDVEAEFDAEGSGWAGKVKGTIPHIEEDQFYWLRRIEKEVVSVGEAIGVRNTDLADDGA